MRSTTVGWLTSIVSVLPVTADHMWLNSARPELRESISQPIEPTVTTPKKSPRMRASTTALRERVGLRGCNSELLGIAQGYHSQSVIETSVHARSAKVFSSPGSFAVEIGPLDHLARQRISPGCTLPD